MERRILHRCIVMLIPIALVLAPSAPAAVGDYSVSIPGTEGVAGWTGYKSSGPYRIADGFIGTGIGSYASGSYEIRRLHVPDATLRIVGGRMAGRISSPQNGFVAKVRVGSEGGAIRTLLETTDSQMFDTSLAGDSSWVDFGLYTTMALTTTATDANYIDMRTLQLNMRDVANPSLSLTRPSAGLWYGNQCVWVEASAADSGSGMQRIVISDESSGVAVGVWTEAVRAGLAPGIPTMMRGACVTPAHAVHGLNSIRVDASDASGRTVSEWLNIRFDLQAPTVTPTIANGAQFTHGSPVIAFDLSDADSGVASTEAFLDGTPATATIDRGRLTIGLRSQLAVGQHTAQARVRDGVGNERTTTVAFTITDVTPPTIVVAGPALNGGPEPWVDVSAVDTQSTIDATSWAVSVDGHPVPLPTATSRLHAPLGMLSAGEHSIRISVSDAIGNNTSIDRRYVVDQVDAASAAAALGGTTALRLGGPASGTVQYATPVRLVAVGARNGRPLAGDRFLARIDGTIVAESVADAHGVAALQFVATRSGTIAIELADGSVQGTAYQLRVSPRITLAAASKQPKRGKAVTISGSVRPLLPGRKVRIEARIENSWYPLQRVVKVDKKGRFRTTVTSAVPGQIAVRVRIASQGSAWAASTSNVVVLRVRR